MKNELIHRLRRLLPCLALLTLTPRCWTAVLYVSTNGNDSWSGQTWPLAKRTVTNAVSSAAANTEIWVAAGYYPGPVILKSSQALYGGFAGTENDPTERDWQRHVTILDARGRGAAVTIAVAGAGRATRVDGFTITGGRAANGGGIRIVAAAPTITQNRVTGNISDGYGAGISCTDYDPLTGLAPYITGNVITDNYASELNGDGAGIACIGSSAVISNNVIARNHAAQTGGGIACWRHAAPVIVNNFIGFNSARLLASAGSAALGGSSARASAGGGGIFASATDLDGRPIQGAISAPFIANNLVVANGGYSSALVFSGGGITLVDSRLGSGLLVNNTVAANNGPGVFWANTTPRLTNNIISGNSIGLQQWNIGSVGNVLARNCVYGHTLHETNSDYVGLPNPSGTNGNFSADPGFADPASGNFHLQPNSPCVNAGASVALAAGWTDLDGQPRLRETAIDLGADEADGVTWTTPRSTIRVRPDGDDGFDGSSWSRAKRSLQAAIDSAAGTGGEVWVAAGTYAGGLSVPAFVSLYGGFAGNETERAQRRSSLQPTTIDGRSGGTVLASIGAGHRTSTIDGFVIQHGVALTETLTGDALGGGILCRVSSPIIANNILRWNSVGHTNLSDNAHGAAIACYLSYASISNNVIATNEVWNKFDGRGGGIYSLWSSPTIERNRIVGNLARLGAAVGCEGSALWMAGNWIEGNAGRTLVPAHLGAAQGAVASTLSRFLRIEGNTIIRNVASQGAGVYLESSSDIRVCNNVIARNRTFDPASGAGGAGGGIYCSTVADDARGVALLNNTIVGNTGTGLFGAEYGGGLALVILNTNVTIANNIIASNSSGLWRYPGPALYPALHHNCVNNSNAANYLNLAAGPTDLVADPGLVIGAAEAFMLQPASPAIDAAADSLAPRNDRHRIPRPLDGNADGIARADIGAHEFASPMVDADADSMSDADEVVAGTHPVDATSVLRLAATMSASPHQIRLLWPTAVGRSYQLEFKTNLAPSESWQWAAGPWIGTGEPLEASEPITPSTHRCYRIAVTPEDSCCGR